MREIRSADPWSAFLSPPGRDVRARSAGAAPAGGSGRTAEAGEASRRVLAQLRDANAPMSLEQIHHATRLDLVEVADAVDALCERGLVAVEREMDEVVRLTGE